MRGLRQRPDCVVEATLTRMPGVQMIRIVDDPLNKGEYHGERGEDDQIIEDEKGI